MDGRRKVATILTLAPFIFTFAFALDIYVPSIPSIHIYFSTTEGMVQWTISLFLLLTGVGQLVVGPISDRVGRKIIIVAGTLCFLVGCILAAFAPTIMTLIVARMIQGLGACSMMVATFAMVRDLYSGDDVAQVYSFLNSGIALSPLIAPIIGGYLAKWYGWRSGFIFLAILAVLITLLALIKVKESLVQENRVTLSKAIFSNYQLIAKNTTFLMYAFAASVGFACFLTFFSVSSYILISILRVPEQHFGFYFAAIGVVFFAGSLLSGYASKKFGTYLTVLMGTILTTLGGIVMLVWYLTLGLSIGAFMGPMMIMGVGGALLMGGGAGGAIEPFPEMAGMASAVFGFCEFVFAFVISTIVLAWKVTNTVPLSLTLICLGFAALVACLLKFKKK